MPESTGQQWLRLRAEHLRTAAKYGKPFPTLEYIKLYREMGGESLSIGSDAHCAEDIGFGMKEALAIAKEAGFSYLCYYLEREPVYIPIP